MVGIVASCFSNEGRRYWFDSIISYYGDLFIQEQIYLQKYKWVIILYICASLPWFFVVFFHNSIFTPCILLWPLIMIDHFIWSILLSDITLLNIFFISIIIYSCRLFIEEKHPSCSQSPSRIAHRYF